MVPATVSIRKPTEGKINQHRILAGHMNAIVVLENHDLSLVGMGYERSALVS